MPNVARGRKRREDYGITTEEFVAECVGASSLEEVAARLSRLCGKEYPKKLVSSRAAQLRRKGVRLRSFGPPPDIEASTIPFPSWAIARPASKQRPTPG